MRVFHPLQINISINIQNLHTALNNISYGTDKESCLIIRASLVGDHFLYSHDLDV